MFIQQSLKKGISIITDKNQFSIAKSLNDIATSQNLTQNSMIKVTSHKYHNHFVVFFFEKR